MKRVRKISNVKQSPTPFHYHDGVPNPIDVIATALKLSTQSVQDIANKSRLSPAVIRSLKQRGAASPETISKLARVLHKEFSSL